MLRLVKTHTISPLPKDSDLAHRQPGHVEITCADSGAFMLWTADEIASCMGRLRDGHRNVQAGTMTRKAFEELQLVAGVNYNPHGLLSDVELRPVLNITEAWTFDWVHNMLQDGVFTTEATLFLRACGEFGIAYSDLRQLFHDDTWCFPHATRVKSKALYKVFDSWRTPRGEPDRVRCSASELLGLVGLLRHFAETVAAQIAALSRELASFVAVCDAVAAIMKIKTGMLHPVHGSRQLTSACEQHLAYHIVAYGSGAIKPKHHWQLDMARQVARDECVIDCFIIERMHLGVKAVAENVKNSKEFERSTLTAHYQLASRLKKDTVSEHSLLGRVREWPGVPHATVSNRLRCLSLEVCLVPEPWG